MPLSIEQQKLQQCLALIVHGAFETTEDAKTLRTAVAKALASGQTLILVDLAQLEKLDDFGTESLLAGSFMGGHRGGLLQVFGEGDGVAAALNRAHVTGLVLTARTVGAAAIQLLAEAAHRGIEYKPFDILEFVREEVEGNGPKAFADE